jgi:hypothetical protein
MRLRRAIIMTLLLFSMVLLNGCRKQDNYDGMTKVVFELEEGSYQNCVDPIIQYYNFENEGPHLINEPTYYTKAKVVRQGYTLKGWYKNKNENNNEITYSDQFDFVEDRINSDGITLYAYWVKDIKYSYDVCYYDETNTLQVLGSYSAEEGSKFKDTFNYANKREGYTAIGFSDENGEPWNVDYEHPGGETNLTINVITEYIKGDFAVVNDSNGLIRAKASGKNIYLIDDIDLKGIDFEFGNFKGIFLGNNHRISNFNIRYNPARDGLTPDFEDENKQSLGISLFGRMEGATLQDITFENVNVNVNTSFSMTYRIYVAPIALTMKNSIINNVNFTGEFSYTTLPTENYYEENYLIFVTDRVYYITDDLSNISDCNVSITIK